ncbi:hypothetical protein BRYFOR_09160 [Marvinbryantia formatexigens DSM 14469]|uniref:Uncharacterized protein n=1 Tax=Marvinbryantia formatexigens DSM 14469 TaxID=478749 RepID=C6LKH3_9FIRM|nr:hypothetical protein BRYFOR_09160 [Marvinbryantia formatexigens DSM 14469]SDG87704.1 hypothetical protein SAMN05660368_03443 [Marvinbryantia formatexigens]
MRFEVAICDLKKRLQILNESCWNVNNSNHMGCDNTHRTDKRFSVHIMRNLRKKIDWWKMLWGK